MTYELVWTSRYGTEVIDETDSKTDAEYLRAEYQMAYGEGTVRIRRTVQKES